MADNEKDSVAVTSEEPLSKTSGRLSHARMAQNFMLLWLDGNIDEVNNEDCRNTIAKLQQVTSNINTFTDADECVDFITDKNEGKVSMIISGTFSRRIVPVLQDISQVSSIYIHCVNKTRHEQWAQQWPKVKGVFTDITQICEALRQAKKEYDQNMVSVSFFPRTNDLSKQNLDQLDSSFMYTQILKEILLTIDFEQKHIDEFLTYCREELADNNVDLKNVDKLQNEYHRHQPIWWYTSDCFLYSMVNAALRMMEVDVVIKMGFFIRDLHNHITELHREQYGKQKQLKPFIVYCGQGLSPVDFDQLMKSKGGLISFNSFLSTSLDQAISLVFADSNQYNADLIGVLFEITIDPLIPSTSYANVTNVSAHDIEEEILFSMHSVFRIGQTKQIDGNTRLWQVELTLTSDKDPQLHVLTDSIRNETSGLTGWYRLGQLMIKLGHFNKAEELYEMLLEQATDEIEKSHLYHMLGMVKNRKGEKIEATICYEKSIKIKQIFLSPTDPNLLASYGNIGGMFAEMGEYSKVLSYYEKVLEIQQKTLPPNHPDLATSYSNIGLLYNSMSQYSEVLSYCEKALEIDGKTLPSNHPDLATSYNNIGMLHNSMGQYSKALSYYEKALEIRQKILSSNHPNLATSYNNIGMLYNDMGQHSKALAYCEKALETYQKSLPPNHPDLAAFYNNIGTLYNSMGQYSKALSYCERALVILQSSLPANHPKLLSLRKNIEIVRKNL